MSRPLLSIAVGDQHEHLADAMTATRLWRPFPLRRVQFSNGNLMYVAPRTAVPDSIDVLWSGTGSVGENVLALSVAMDCLWRANPRIRATVIVPYLPYSRSSRVEDGSSLGAAALFRLLDAVPGIERYAAFELHSPETVGFSRRPVHELSILDDVSEWARTLAGVDAVVAPDRGRAGSCAALAQSLGVSGDVVLKRRDGHDDRARRVDVERPALKGRTVLVYDDEFTTGATVRAALDTLGRSGASTVHVLVARTFASPDVVKECAQHPLVGSLATTSLSDAAAAGVFRDHGLAVVPVPLALQRLAVRHD
ncbi:phosphoribosyltransferase family protein [Streptomyces sp. NPDC058964]|uniref:phosphoribosyltransferase family protein n=1 Tax=Streptomyces sp. NPDC058964 TaxID=3346681 RepID=UPI00369640BD